MEWSPAWRQKKLDALRQLWEYCEECPLNQGRTNVVFGEGNPAARILFCGEAPGSEEDREGSPFVGPSGKLFNVLLYKAGIHREDVYITNIVACRPPDNRDPTAAERNTCISRVHDIIYIVDPLIVVAVGKVAAQALTKKDLAITDVRGTVFSNPSPAYKVNSDKKNGIDLPGKIFPLKFKQDGVKYTQSLDYDMIPILHPMFLVREDNIDPDTRKFPENGLTAKTVADLRSIKHTAQQLSAAYQL